MGHDQGWGFPMEGKGARIGNDSKATSKTGSQTHRINLSAGWTRRSSFGSKLWSRNIRKKQSGMYHRTPKTPESLL